MRYLSVCSGIEAASVAWESLGWKPVAFAEVEPFASAVLSHHWPDVPNLGDINQIEGSFFKDEVDVLVGGTPCFPAGELVLTPDGYVPIETLRIGDRVIAENGSIQRVTAVGSKQARVGELKILGRSPIRCTPNHPFLCMEMKREYRRNDPAYGNLIPVGDFGFVRADQSVGMYAGRPLFREVAGPEFPECYGADRKDIVELAGWYVGDGYIRGWSGKSTLAVVLALTSEEKIRKFRSRFEGKFHFHIGKDNRITITSTALARWLTDNFGKLAAGKKIPYWLYKHEYKEDFLQGYRLTHGFDAGKYLKYATISKSLAHGIADLYGNASVKVTITPETHNIEGRTVQQRNVWDTTAWFELKETARTRKVNGRWASIVRWFRYDPDSEPVTVYNITVENEHTYIVNGIATHNCQAYSIAGLRKGMADARGNLTMQFVRLANEIDPAFIVWENVPGVLSDRGNAFGYFLAGLAGEDAALEPPGKKWTDAGYVLGPQRAVAWRVLDAQYFGLAQRRRRVFVVGCPREGVDPRKILFEFEGMRRDSPPSRETGETVASTIKGGSGSRGWENGCECNFLPVTAVARCLSTSNQRHDHETETLIPARRIAVKVASRNHWEGGPHPTLGQSAQNSGGIGQSDQEIFSQGGAGLVPGYKDDVAYAIHPHCIGRGPESGPQGKEYLADGSAYTLDTKSPQAVIYRICSDENDSMESGSPAGDPANEQGDNTIVQPIPISTQNALGEHSSLGIGEPGAPAFTLLAGHSHAVCAPLKTSPHADNVSSGSGRGLSFHGSQDPIVSRDISHCLGRNNGRECCIAIQQNQVGEVRTSPVMGTLNTNSNASGRNAPLVCAPLTTSPHADNAAQESRLVLSVRETGGSCITVPEKSGFAPVPFAQNVRDELRILPGYVGVLAAQPGMKQQTFLAYPLSVRRLMPQECERLQGFPRGHTAIPYRGKPSSDSSRYKVIGNSMPVPVMHWIGKRIAEVSREQD